MAIVAYFESQLSSEQYDAIVKGLEEKELGTPDGRMQHTAWQSTDGWRVVDAWESEEHLGKFAETLIPLMAELGTNVPPPQVFPLYNFIKG